MGEGRRLESKKTWGGMKGRLALLAREGIVLPDELGDVDAVGIDDVIDAAEPRGRPDASGRGSRGGSATRVRWIPDTGASSRSGREREP